MTNAIAISRDLVGAGFAKPQADAIAEIVVTHLEAHIDKQVDDRINARIDTRDKTLATKGDVTTATARLEGKVNTTHANFATKDDVNAIKDDVAKLRTEIREANARSETREKILLVMVGAVLLALVTPYVTGG